MKSSIGCNLLLNVFGESHKKYIGATLSGLLPGIKIDEEYIKKQLYLRSSFETFTTGRKERDEFEIISGVYNGFTTGTPLTIIIKNNDIDTTPYDSFKNIARPGHADYTQFIKYNGFQDIDGGGHSSGRITSSIVAVCSILLLSLLKKNIKIKTHIKQVCNIKDTSFSHNPQNLKRQMMKLEDSPFPLINKSKQKKIYTLLNQIKNEKDSVSGILETAIIGMPPGIGEPFFDSMESVISHLMFSIPGVKGIQFGLGFDGVKYKGSKFNDEFYITDNKIKTKTNNNGGINGGITNSEPVIFSVFIKPPSSISKKQKSVNFIEKKEVELVVNGRNDAFIASRCIPIVNSLTAFAVYDMIISHCGYNYFS